MAGDESIARVDEPDERGLRCQPDQTRMPAHQFEHIQYTSPTDEVTTIASNHDHRSVGFPAKLWRHRRAWRLLRRSCNEHAMLVEPPEPGDGIAAEGSVAVPDQPVVVPHHSKPFVSLC